jgi:hypothetical protein
MYSAPLPVSGLDSGDAFGRRVAVSGSTLVVGAHGDDERGDGAGAAHVFERGPDGTWKQTAKLLGALQREGDAAGWAVAIDGDVAVVGAPGDDRDNTGAPNAASANRGAAYIFRRTASGWVEEARLQPPESPQAGNEFGGRVAVSGDTVAVSAFYLDVSFARRAGGVWVYRRTSGGWLKEALLVQGSPAFDGRFGFDVSLEGDLVVVGEPGAARVTQFRRRGPAWEVAGGVVPRTGISIDGRRAAARFASVAGLATAGDATALVLECCAQDGSGLLRGISPEGAVTTVGRTAATPSGTGVDLLAAPASGDVFYVAFVASRGEHEIHRRDPGGNDTTLAGGFRSVTALEADGSGGVFLADGASVKRITGNGVVTTVAGVDGEFATVDGVGAAARFREIRAIATDGSGALLLVDGTTIRRLTPDNATVVTVAGTSRSLAILEHADGTGTAARFAFPRALAVNAGGDVYIADGSTIRRMTPAYEVSTVAGTPFGGSVLSQPVDGLGAAAQVEASAMTTDPAGGGVVFFDRGTVRAMTAAGQVFTRAGLPLLPFGSSGLDLLYGYSVDLAGSRLVVGMAGATPPTTTIAGAGMAWVFERTATGEWDQGMPVVVDAPQATARYGEAVTITPEGDLVVGAANGCTWIAPGQCVNSSIGTAIEDVVSPPVLFRRTSEGLWTQRLSLSRSDATPKAGMGSALGAGGVTLAVAEPAYDVLTGVALGPGRVFVYDLATLDLDGDTLPDQWETAFGLDPQSTSGANGRDGDPDADGQTNPQEYASRTHPRGLGSATRYFAEGATSSFFETRLAVANPGTETARVGLRFALTDQSIRTTTVQVPAGQSRKIALSQVPGLAAAEFSTVLETDQPVVAERQMWWSATSAYGTHSERAIGAPALTWYLAEGATHSGFDLFYLLQNPNSSESQVRVRYLRPSGAPLEKTYALPPNSRTNIWVDVEEFGGQAVLSNTDVSAAFEVVNGQPIIVERAMYLTRSQQGQGSLFEAGHESAGVTEGASEWFLAEGATGTYFDLFVLVANPGSTAATIEATYLLPDGSNVVKTYSVPPASRFNIWVDLEDPRLADTAVSTTIRSTNGVPIVVERAMWWPGPTSATWTEAHNSPGSVESATRWGIGDGVVQDQPAPADTYILVANVGAVTNRVRVTLLYDDGGPAESRQFDVPPRSRFNVDVRAEFPTAVGRGFGAIVESVSGGPIVVERAIYNDAFGIRWAAGNNALATKLP